MADLEEEAVDMETALHKVGVGRFQVMALLVCGLANAADAVEILGMSLVLPAAEGDPEFDLTQRGKSALSSCIFLGMLIGGLLWGSMGDVLGRRKALMVALLINGFMGFMSAGARSEGALVCLRLLGGIGVGGSVPVVFSYLAELLPAHARGKYMVALAAHWMVGSIFSAGMGWAIIPSGADAWRLFLVVAAVPAWCAAVGTWLLPESPRFLLVQGDTQAAEQVLQQMSAVNNKGRARMIRLIPHTSHHLPQPAVHSHHQTAAAAASSAQDPDMSWQHARGHHSQTQPSSGMVVQSDLPAAVASHSVHSSSQEGQEVGSSSSSRVQGGQQQQFQQRERGAPQQQQQQRQQQRQRQLRQCCKSSWTTTRLLLQPPLLQRFLPLLVAWLGMCGGWYSTVLWIPEYFKARGAHSASIYAETFAVAAANLPGNIASVFMVDRLGRRLTACICLAGACVAALLFAFAPADPVWSVAAACIFNGISVGGWNALDLLSAELFATEVRSTAMGLLGASGRLASFTTTYLAGVLMQKLLWSPLLVAAALLAAGSIAIMLLPEMAHMPLDDTIEDAQDAEVITTVMTSSGGEGGSRAVYSRAACGDSPQQQEQGEQQGLLSGSDGRPTQQQRQQQRRVVEVELGQAGT